MSLSNRTEPSPTPTPWWRRAVTYQVYVRSFADDNGDGTGDINGLRSRLPYLQSLGVDAVWINPWYRSPLADGGYDVADYRSIDPRFGTLDDAVGLITEAHDHNIAVIVDLVPNHTSDQHQWFIKARNAPVGHPSRERYHIKPGLGDDGELPPNDWTSVFGGPAWTRLDDGEWYLHLYAPEQPDLNWTNHEVRSEFESVLRFWLDRHVDGFRVDVAHGLVKDPDYADLGAETDSVLSSAKFEGHPYWDRDEIHEIVREWRAVLDSYQGDRMMVAEAWVRAERLPLYLRPDEYHQSFNFDLLQAPWDADRFRTIIADAVAAAADVGSAPTWVLSNHDVMREVTRYGLPNDTDWRAWPVAGPVELLDVDLGLRRARAAALILLALPGSAYVYQGEELGLPEVWDLPPDVLDDPVWENSHHTRKGRDGCRVPLPWTSDGPSYGFGSGSAWLPQPEIWAELAADRQAGDAASVLELYRAAIDIRRRHGIDDESLTMFDLGDDVVAYRRGSGLVCIANMGAEPVEMPDGHVELLRSDSSPAGSVIMPDTALLALASESADGPSPTND